MTDKDRRGQTDCVHENDWREEKNYVMISLLPAALR
jgi:hypothetical protein